MDPKATYFGTYDEAKTRISLEIQIPQILKMGKKRLETIRKKIVKSDTKGNDVEEEDGEEESDGEQEKEEEPPKKKEKTPSKPLKRETRSTLVIIASKPRKLRKNLKLQDEDEDDEDEENTPIISLKKAPPTFEK